MPVSRQKIQDQIQQLEQENQRLKEELLQSDPEGQLLALAQMMEKYKVKDHRREIYAIIFGVVLTGFVFSMFVSLVTLKLVR